MFTRRITLFTIFGFTVRLDLSWLLMAALVTSSMASGFREPPDSFPRTASWIMGGFVAVGLFVSIVAHELTHSLVARLHGMNMKGITLFILGGVAEMDEEPPTPWAEFTMAIVGPLASVFIALMLGGAWWMSDHQAWPGTVTTVLKSLGTLNLVLAIFNMVPAFPLDGGRVLRSILWGARGNLHWATRIASIIGTAFGALLVAAGVFFVLVWPGAWQGMTWVLIGLFVMVAARMSMRRMDMTHAFEGLTLRRFVDAAVVAVPRWIPLSELVESYVYRYQEPAFPVVDGDRLVGMITIDHVKAVPRPEWGGTSVGELTIPIPPEALASLDEDAGRALERMGRTRMSQLFVVEDGQLAGVVRMADMVGYLQLRSRIEG